MIGGYDILGNFYIFKAVHDRQGMTYEKSEDFARNDRNLAVDSIVQEGKTTVGSSYLTNKETAWSISFDGRPQG